MAGSTTLTLLDYSNEQSTMRVYTPDLDATNIAPYVDDNIGGHLGDLRLAVSALSLMNQLRRQVVATQIVDAAVLPTDPNAQRERKALISCRDTVNGRAFTLTIPGFNMVGAEPGTDNIDLDLPQWVAFRAVYESNYVSPFGNPLQIISAKHVGRNS